MNNIKKAIDNLIYVSRFYDYDSKYEKHIKRMKKLKKKLKNKGDDKNE